MIWEEAQSTGHEEIDQQHKRIAELISQLDELLKLSAANGAYSIPLRRIISEFQEYSFNHLHHEELLMQSHNYPKYEEHCQSHQYYRTKVIEFSTRALTLKRESDARELLEFLKDWWTHHILIEDQKFKNYI